MKHEFSLLLQQFKQQLTQVGFKGDFHFDQATCLLNATDNSIYEVMPLAVAQPKNHQDVVTLLQLSQNTDYANFHFCARGGGTGTNGQSLTQGIVIDFSRYMNKIIEFDPQQRTISVEPGVILSDLNRKLQAHGLFFAPNVSTADRATIGGMIATDAAGKGSLIYGKTSDHLIGLQLVLADGSEINNLDTITSNKFEQPLINLLQDVQTEIDKRFPPLKRPLSGYNIRQAYQNQQVNLNYLIAGSEGTLGLVTAAKLNLLPIPQYKALIVIHYSNFIEALRDAEFLIQFKPLAIEAIDEKVQQSAQSLPNWPTLAKLLNCEQENYVSNFMEIVANSQAELDQQLNLIELALSQRNNNFVTIQDNSQINQLWSIRSLAVGLVAKLPGKRKPIAFVEDAIVPPQYLADFVNDLQLELNKLGFNYAMYGHVDVGCIHVRPALDLQQSNDRQQIRPITELVISILDRYQGILWGEHGKGYRGEFVPHVFGPILYPVLCQIKALFDPNNRLNQGKLTTSDPHIPLQRIEQVTMRGELDQIIPQTLQDEFSGAILCNGNGACFNRDPVNVMCPSYKVTGNRIHSPKGRATLIKQWLRTKPQSNSAHQQAAKDAYEALNGCLSCHGCSGKCPTQVRIPDLRSKFLAHYHKYYAKRNLRELLLAYIEHLAPWIAKFPWLWNKLSGYQLIPQRLGLINLPKFNSLATFNQQLEYHKVKLYHSAQQVKQLPANAVVIFTDVFTGLFEQNVLWDTCQVLVKLNKIPYLIMPQPSGKALLVAGMLEQFKHNSQQLAQLVNPLLEANIPVLSLENTLVNLFRDDFAKFANKLTGKVQSIAEYLSSDLTQLTNLVAKFDHTVNYCLLPHCTEQALLPQDAVLWQKIYQKLNLNLQVKNLGCCGMAGSYGHLAEQQTNSQQLFAMHWQSHLANPQIIYLASGYSCRSQVKHQLKQKLAHPIQIINQFLGV
ncbi:MAG: hypothetical protein RLZZ293_1470 [Pseudomonadota bacterium]|jgi:FAD/FMN-containing dehydrogenase/Fe-S oxidoreductase